MINSNFHPNRRGFSSILVVVVLAIVLIAGYLWWARSHRSASQNQNIITSTSTGQFQNTSTGSGNNPPVACTQEAKQCPDGSYVARAGPNCTFAACPAVSGNGILSGKVTVGPICPVERVGVPCPVPSAAYTSREVIVYAANGTTVIARKNFNPDGTYSFSLAAGSYVVNTPNSGIGGARNLPETVIIKSGETTTLDLSIDTGIR